MNDANANTVIQTIIDGYEPLKIIVFGSYARNEYRSDSDLDLLIVKDTSESYYKRPATIRGLFEKQPCPLDILVFTPEEFEDQKTEINNIVNIAVKTGVVVYEKVG
jgi:predicted nucleotidyltransferase